jgi:F0F1-type ATP synthase membrane subunit b/b'
MTNETRRKIDKAVKISLIIAGLLLICNDVYWRWHSGSSSAADNNVTSTVESIQRANESARSEIESGRREVEAAKEHVKRAADAVGRSTEAAQANARSTDELQSLISECQGIVEAQRGLIQDIDQENGIGEQEEPQG